MPGALVCKHHGGGAPQTEQAAQVRQFVDTVAAAGPPRPVWQVLLDAVALADDRMRGQGDADSIRLAAGLASESIKSRAAEMQAEAANGDRAVDEETGQRIVDAVSAVVAPVLAEVGGRRHDDVSAWVGPAVAAALTGQPVPALPPVDRDVVPAVPVRRPVAAIGPSRQVAPDRPGDGSRGDPHAGDAGNGSGGHAGPHDGF